MDCYGGTLYILQHQLEAPPDTDSVVLHEATMLKGSKGVMEPDKDRQHRGSKTVPQGAPGGYLATAFNVNVSKDMC